MASEPLLDACPSTLAGRSRRPYPARGRRQACSGRPHWISAAAAWAPTARAEPTTTAAEASAPTPPPSLPPPPPPAEVAIVRTPVPPPPPSVAPPPPPGRVVAAEAHVAEEAADDACDGRVVFGLAALLEGMALRTAGSEAATSFHSSRPPAISLRDYLARFQNFMGCSNECYVLSLVYVDRLVERNPEMAISPRSCHRTLACSLVLAAKFQDDIFYSNKFYAKIAGMSLQELNKLEQHMLELLGYRLVVSPEEFEVYRRRLCDASAQPMASQADAK